MSIHLLMSSNSIRNTTFSCDSLGIHYDVSKHDGVVTVQRWDSSTNTNTTVGEIKSHVFSKDQIKLGAHMVEAGEWHDTKDVLIQTARLSDSRSFEGKDGKRYKWKSPWGYLVMCHDNENESSEPLITYHHKRLGKDPSYLEVHDSSVMINLDYIIVTFLVMERKVRDEGREAV